MLNRRTFLSLSGAALLSRNSFAAEDFGGFTVGIQSYTFRKFGFEQAMKKTQELGLKYAELYRGHLPTDSSPEKIRAAKKLCAEYGITPIAFGVENFSKDHDKNKKLFEFGANLGIKHLSADPNPDSFDSLDKLCAEYKISIAIHPHGPAGGGKLHRWADAATILKAVKDHHELIGTCLDTGHLIRSAQLGVELDSAKQVLEMGKRNFGMHLKDHDNKRKTDVPYGDPTGKLDVPSVLKALREVKFSGYISIEYEANENNPSPDVQKCVTYLKDAIKKLG
jgi:inosose dehydratase